MKRAERGRRLIRRTDIAYDGIELGLVPRGKEDIETRFGKLNRKFASNTVRRASDDLSQRAGNAA
jgi:hypothetical protein